MTEHDHHKAEAKEASRVPAYVANRFVVVWGNNNVRLCFGDKPTNDFPTTFNTHVMLSHDDAAALIDLLSLMKAQHEAETATKN